MASNQAARGLSVFSSAGPGVSSGGCSASGAPWTTAVVWAMVPASAVSETAAVSAVWVSLCRRPVSMALFRLRASRQQAARYAPFFNRARAPSRAPGMSRNNAAKGRYTSLAGASSTPAAPMPSRWGRVTGRPSSAKTACMHREVKRKASPSSRESRLKEAARCRVMGSRAAAANTRRPKGANRTARDASAAKTSRLASRPSSSTGTKPRCSRNPRNTAAALTRYRVGLRSVWYSASSTWLS